MNATMSSGPELGVFARYRDSIAALPPGELSRRQVLDGRFEIVEGAGFRIHYAPFDHVNRDARVVLVGLTPGWQQTRLAFETARDRVRDGDSDERVLWAVKQQASFAGMRARLAGWLDGIGVDRALGLDSAAELFGSRARLLQTTSAVRYPVFCAGKKNWSGSRPSITEPPLPELVGQVLGAELNSLPDALVIPLGVAVQAGLRDLVDRSVLDPDRCLFGFPHPSGANASGVRRYAEARPRLTAVVARWAGLRIPRGESPPRGPRTRRTTALAVTRRTAPDSTTDAKLPDGSTLQRLILAALAALGGRAQRRAIRTKAVELGNFSPAQLAIPAPPSKLRQYPNQLAYQLDWALNTLHRERLVRRVGLGEWALA